MTAQPDRRPLDATLSVTKAAKLLGVHPNTVRAWSEQGRLRYYRINARGDRRYRVGDLRNFLSEAERGAAGLAAAIPRPGLTPLRALPRPDVRGFAGGVRLVPAHAGPTFHPRAPRPLPGRFPRPNGAATPASTGELIRRLAELADLLAGARAMDARLQAAARLIRDALDAAEVTILEVSDERLLRRAVVSAAGTAPSAEGRAPLADDDGAGAQAVAQRRPVVKPLELRQREGRVDIAVPIGTEHPWGALVASLSAMPAGDDVVTWLEGAAALIGSSVRSAALLDEAALEVHRGEALRRVALDTNASFDLDETLGRVVDHAMTLFAADRGGIFLRQPGADSLKGVSRGLSSAYLGLVRRAQLSGLTGDAARERRPVFATAYRDDQRAAGLRAAIVQEGFDTICAAPLLDGDDTIGMINLYHDRPKAWTPPELETIAAFASQVTVAIRAAQQFTQLARWAAQLQSIQQLGARLNRLTTIPEIASAIAMELRVLIEYDNIRVYRLDGDDLNAVALHATDAAYEDETPDLVRSRLGEGITGWVAAHGVAQNLPDSSVDPRTEDIPGSEAFDESMLLAPLIFEDRVLGVIALASLGLNRFGDDDLRLLEIYAAFAAQAMANADATERLRAQSETLQRQIRSQRELLDITESILSTLDPRAVLSQIADRLGRLVRYDALAIDVTDRRTGALAPVALKGPDGEPRPAPLPDDGLAGWVMRHNEARLVGPTPDDPDVPSRIVLPLRGRDGVTGVLTLSRESGVAPFTGDEFELVQLFGAQASIALHNAETHRAVEVRANTDALTGLLNHGSLRDWLARSAATGAPFGLIMLDLDEFKAVNDAFGHQAGDRLLADIGAAIVSAGRETDLVFRYGGDEFAIVLPGTDADGAMQVAARIAAAVRGVHRPGGRREVDITASIGVARFPDDGVTGDDMLIAADRACFVAKRDGRGRIADAAQGLALAAEFSLQEPTPVDSD
jgi:diguanylate cyclase (GGDEF)-like protein/excisionase family DNA binding protein